MAAKSIAWKRILQAFAAFIAWAPLTASAQLAPLGGNLAARASDTGFTGGIVDSGGGFAASVPLELAPARHGLPVPVSIQYIGRRMGSAGLGWDVPISYVRRVSTFAGQRPKGNPAVDGQDGVETSPEAPERVFLVFEGQRYDLVPKGGGVWVPRLGAPQLELRDEGDTWEMFDGAGTRYVFSDLIVGPDAPDGSRTRPLQGKNLFPLVFINDAHGGVSIDTLAENVALPNGNTGVAIDLQRVRYNNDPVSVTCYRDQVVLRYDIASADPYTFTMLGDLIWARRRIVTGVEVYSHKPGAPCVDEQAPTPNYVQIRRYELQYPIREEDTHQFQLGAVLLHGQEGTAEASQSIPIATYTYATASDRGGLRFGFSTGIDFSGLTGDPFAALSEQDDSVVPSLPNITFIGTGLVLHKTLLDMNGDGRPDMVFANGDRLTAAMNLPGSDGDFDFSFQMDLRNGVLPDAALEVRSTLLQPRVPHTSDQVWQQAIDMNGDGRIDIVSAREIPGKWVIYLNKGTAPTLLSGFGWERHEVSVQPLLDRLQDLQGLGNELDQWGGFLPIENRVTERPKNEIFCARWDPTQRDDAHPHGTWVDFSEGLGHAPCTTPPTPHGQLTASQWELQDANGDGYPDFVYSGALPTVSKTSNCPFPTDLTPDAPTIDFGPVPVVIECRADRTFSMNAPNGGPGPALFAALNTFGTLFPDQRPDVPIFSLPVGLSVGLNSLGLGTCGVGQWDSSPDDSVQTQSCGFQDVNGDGFPDWVQGQTAYLNSGVGGVGLTTVTMALPGPLTRQTNNRAQRCPSSLYQSDTLAAFRDMNGDGFPDYVSKGAGGWTVQMGTGAGFVPPMPIDVADGEFALSREVESCGFFDDAGNFVGKTSATSLGLYDLDGDGIPEIFDPFSHLVLRLQKDGASGVPQAGQLVAIGNGHGETTSVTYRSAKENESFADSHLVPFPENVATQVVTKGLPGANHDLAPIQYAFGRIGLVYDRVVERFVSTGYQRAAELRQTSATGGMATITDRYGPFFALHSVESAEVLFLNLARIGHVSDVRVLSGDLGTDPWALLPLDLTEDHRRIAEVHHDLGVKMTTETDPSEPTCPDPANAAYNACATHGFAYDSNVGTTRGTPIDLAGNNASTAAAFTVDDFGRVTNEHRFGDVGPGRSDDDICVDTQYAPPAGTDTRVLSAVSMSRVTDCNGTILAQRTSTYDGRADGKVDAGFMSAGSASRLDEQGRTVGRDMSFTATADVFGNPHIVTRQRTDTRSDGTQVLVTQQITTTFDRFGLVPTDVTTSGTNVAERTVHVHYDEPKLLTDRTTDPNGTATGTTYDGFGRPRLRLVQPAGGTLGAVSCTQYLGFAQGEAGPQQVRTTELVDAVDPQVACATAGHTSTTTLDELGRSTGTAVDLGGNYPEGLVVGAAQYDDQGRVFFMPDPLPASQNPKTSYGTTYTYNADGTPACSIRGNGPQPANAVTNLGSEVIATCYDRHFLGGREVLTLTEPDGKQRRSESSAIGRMLTQKTLGPTSAGSPVLERADLEYDRLGHRTAVTRYRNPAAAAEPVRWTMHYDSLGAERELDEPGAAPRLSEYDDWGNLTKEHWNDGTDHAVSTTYDALSRPIHREERTGSSLEAPTVSDFVYDAPPATPLTIANENVMGRLARASTPAGAVYLSYDGLGRLGARTYVSNDSGDAGELFIESRDFHADGSLQTLHFSLPDNLNADESVAYTYDSAGRMKTVTSLNSLTSPPIIDVLYQATTIDTLGRVRAAKYGSSISYAAHYADTGRRLVDDVTVSAPPLLNREVHYDTFDVLGRETARQEHVGSQITATASTYDALGRLIGSQATTNGSPSSSPAFSYDPLGNVLSQGDPLTHGANDVAMSFGDASSAPDLDRICRIEYGRTTLAQNDCNVVYDQAGAIVTQPARNGNRHFTYFPDGLTRLLTDDHGNRAQFRYDAFGQLEALDLTSSEQTLEHHDRHFGALIERRETIDPSPVILPDCAGCLPPTVGSIIERRVPGPDGVVATRHGAGGPWVFAFGEERGNRFFADDTGAPQQAVDYRPFGEATLSGEAETGTTMYTAEQWNGGEALEAFGLVHLGARLYDPAIGRFLTRDPLLGGNPYSFAGNDPINYSDPTGFCGGPEEPPCSWPILTPTGGGGGSGGANHKKPPPAPHTATDQRYAQWLGRWEAYSERARARLDAVEDKLKRQNLVDFAYKRQMIDEEGADPSALGSDYARARTQVDLAAAQLSVMEEVMNWLEAQEALGRSVSFAQTSAKALEIAHARDVYMRIMMPVFAEFYGRFVAPQAGGLGRGRLGGALEEGCPMCQASCFTAGTPVATESGTVPIETVQPGDRVDSKDQALCTEPVDPSACRMVTVEMENPYGYADTLTARFLKSTAWTQDGAVELGQQIQLRIDELHIDGPARVTSIDSCHIAPGSGCLVTGTVSHLNSAVLRLHFVGSDETLEPTATHRLWSADRDSWVAAGDLQVGERLVTETGTVTLGGIERVAGKHRVFNFEVAGAHTYLVSNLRIKSHNAEDCGVVVHRPPGEGSDIYGVIRVTDDGAVEIAVTTRGEKAHVNLASETWGPLQVGERRYGFFSNGPFAMVTNTSVGPAPAGADVIPVLRALEAAGFTDDIAIGTTWYPAGPK